MTLARRAFVLAPFAALAKERPKALVIDGVNNHDWQAGTRFIREVLTPRFDVSVSTTPPREAPASAWESWDPALDGVGLVISNFNGGHLANGLRWPARFERKLTQYLGNGGGFVVFHAANNAFLGWDDYNEIIGLGWRDKTFGPSLVVGERGETVVIPAGEGPGPGHGPRHDFEMAVNNARHPVTRGLPKRWMHASEQLTHGQRAVAQPRHGEARKELTILTCALSKDSGKREPMDWVRSWAKGRVYATMLGHTWRNEPNPNLDDPHFRRLFLQGCEWAARV